MTFNIQPIRAMLTRLETHIAMEHGIQNQMIRDLAFDIGRLIEYHAAVVAERDLACREVQRLEYTCQCGEEDLLAKMLVDATAEIERMQAAVEYSLAVFDQEAKESTDGEFRDGVWTCELIIRRAFGIEDEEV